MTKPIRDFTSGELDWMPWVTPVAIDAANEEQRRALKITPSNRAVGAYSLVLAHDPPSLAERSPLYNAIMFGAGGLPRADRELAAVATSRVNGCSYCASVHAQRYMTLSKRPEVMRQLLLEGAAARLDERSQAIVAFAARLSENPAAVGASDARELRRQGLGDAEILDLAHSVAMFAWANRLMQSLGEPTAKA